jgi:hypothetical protein
MALAAGVGLFILAIGVTLFHTDSGKGNQIPAAIAWCTLGGAIVAGTIIKGSAIFQPPSNWDRAALFVLLTMAALGMLRFVGELILLWMGK